MEEVIVPPGWRRFEKKGRIVYASPSTEHCPSVTIYSRSELAHYHKKGRYCDVKVDQLVFASKRKPRVKSYEVKKTRQSEILCATVSEVRNVQIEELDSHSPRCESDRMEVNDEFAPMIADNISSKHRRKLEREQIRLADAVKKLTIDPEKQVDHNVELESAARKISEARASNRGRDEGFDVQRFKVMLSDCENVDDMTKLIWKNPYFQRKFSHLFTSKLVEQLMAVSSANKSPLKSFPVDINRIVYSDVMHFALENAKDVMLLLTTLTKKNENPISTKDVIDLAYRFTALAEGACPQNNTMKKLKSLCLRNSGLTNTGQC